MKFSRLIFISIFIVAFVSSSIAQRRGPSKEEMERFQVKKIAFITDKLEFTPEEAQQFWPVYNQSEKEYHDAQHKRREIEQKVREENGNLSDKEIIELTQQMVRTHKVEADIKEKYNKKYLNILPPKKVLKLYQSEYQFRIEMLHEYRKRKSERK